MTDMARQWAENAIAAIEARDEEQALFWLTAYFSTHTDTRTPMVVDAFMRDDFDEAVAQIRMQMAT